MASSTRLSTSLARRARETARRRRDRGLKVESLEPRLAMATGLLSTLVSVVRDDNSRSLLAPGATAQVAEGQDLPAHVRLTRKPDSAITVSFKSLAPLEVGAPLTTLRFTPANWNQPQPVSFRSLQDGSRDGNSLVPVTMSVAVAAKPQVQSAKQIWIDSLDSRVVTPATPVTATYRGTISGGRNSGSVSGTYDSVTNRGTATIKLTMPTLYNVRNQVITVGYSVGADNRVQIESLTGIAASRFRWDVTYRELGADRGLFGTVTVLQPQFGTSATATMTAAAVPEAVQNLAVAPTGVGSLLLSWTAPTGGATGYTVTMNTQSYTLHTNADDGNWWVTAGTSPTSTTTTSATSMQFTGLSANTLYAFTVVANNAAGTGPSSTTVFQGLTPVVVGAEPWALTQGADGSIWVANNDGNSVQQIVNTAGVWVPQPPIAVGSYPAALTTGQDGSIWVANSGSNTVQQITNVGGTWTAQPAIAVGSGPARLLTASDGSIWVSNYGGSTQTKQQIPQGNKPPKIQWTVDFGPGNTIQQIVNVGGTWTAQPAITTAKGPFSLASGADGSIWVSYANAQGTTFVDTGGRASFQGMYLVFADFVTNGTATYSNTVQQFVNSNGTWTAQPAITVGQLPTGITTGSDGSIWVANFKSNSVQQIKQVNNTWSAQAATISGGTSSATPKLRPWALSSGLDGSIWASFSGSFAVQQISMVGGVPTAQPALTVGARPGGITTGADGSIWITNPQTNTVQQIDVAPLAPPNVAATSGPGANQMTLAWTAPPDGGSPIVNYTVTAYQGTTSQTITTSSTSCTFSGLTSGQGTTYFTVTASNFVGTSPAAGLLLGPDGNPIPTTNTGVGVVTDGTPFTGGGFDGDGNAYSWQALGSSPTLAWNGVIFNLGSPNQPDFTFANGQTIPVPQGAYTTLNLAGAAVNGSQTNQQITLTFTDNSTVTWTQSFSDWGSPQNYGHEAIISTQSYRDTSTGGTSQFTNHVYGYSYTIPTGKTLASITLPKTNNVRILDIQMSTATSVDLSSAYTSWGIANGSTQVANKQGFDGGGYYYYSSQLGPLVAWSGATFNFGTVPTSSSGAKNFVQAKGQSVSLPLGNYSWLYLAGAGANGGQQNQKLTLTFTDDSTATWTQSFSDWCSSSGYSGETIIQQQSSRVNQVGNVHSQTNYVYGYAYQIPAGKTLKSITLPNNTNNLGILGMAMM